MNIELRELTSADRDSLALGDAGNGWNADPTLWLGYAPDQAAGRRLVGIACDCDRPLGYGTLVWNPGYEHFRAAHIPEINNLGVDVKVRRRGVDTRLIRHFEAPARQAGRAMAWRGPVR